MKKVELFFPDSTSLSKFIIENSISNADVNSKDLLLTAIVPDEQIVIAETKFKALPMLQPKKYKN